ncbi:unnamed protein product [Moneuplotes crassus]|uniref:Uncharacterized protein n=1 Tax=Euplotes crassus TaxID=5936 RepID=A0AAD1UH58_EUPCR|nr:unnamed protein product [Moneuplotes crassus]
MLPKLCRSSDYFVDAFSAKNIELGTQEFPYRSFTSLASEVLNIHSNTERTLRIFTNDCYIKDNEILLINITNVILMPLPDYNIFEHYNLSKKSPQKPLLVPTHFEQHGISEKALFHILSHADMQVDKVLAESKFSTYEKDKLSAYTSTIKPLRTSLEIMGVDFYREEIDYNQKNKLITPIYAQDRLLKIVNTDINITGEIVITNDPINVHFENITVEGYSLRSLFDDNPVVYNYPEAFVRPSFYAKNISYVIYKDRTTIRNTDIFLFTGPANVTIENIDIGRFYSTAADYTSAISCFISPQCIPEDEESQIYDVNGYKSRFVFDGHKDRTFGNLFFIYQPHYRNYEVNFTNFDMRGLHIYQPFTVIPIGATPIDSFYISNVFISNATVLDDFIGVGWVKKAILTNVTIENVFDNNGIITLVEPLNVIVSDISVRDYTAKSTKTLSDFEITSLLETEISINRLFLSNCIFRGAPFIDTNQRLQKFELTNGFFQGIQNAGQVPIMHLRSVSSLAIMNHTFENVSIPEGDEPLNYFIDIVQLKLEEDSETILEDISFDNADISFINVKTITSVNAESNIVVNNLAVMNTYFQTSRSIISTHGFEVPTNCHLVFENFTASNISFKTKGELFNFKHYLLNPVVIRNSVFEDLSSASIVMNVIRPSNSSMSSKVRFESCQFTKIQNPQRSFIDSPSNGYFEIASSNFSEISSINDFSGVLHLSSRSHVFFSDCIFTNNSAISSGLFKADRESNLTCVNCKIYNNFALKYAIFEAHTGGRMQFVNTVLSNNYAIQHSIGIIQETVQMSVFSNCTIFGNSYATQAEIIQAVNNQCNRVCMLSNELKQHLGKYCRFHMLATNLSIVTVTEPSIFSLGLITGSILINSETEIYNQPYFVNSFLSNVEFTGLTLHSIEFSDIYSFLLSSNVTIQNSSIYSVNSANEGTLLETSDSRIIINNITYSNSNAAFIVSSSAELYVKSLVLDKIHGSESLMDIYRSPKLKLEDIQLADYSTSTSRVIFIDKCEHLIILNTTVANYTKTLFVIRNSYVSLIENLHVTGYYRALEVVNSNIQLINHSSFSQCGSDLLIYAGALYIEESNATLSNTSFVENKAVSGGAIASICSTHINCNVKIQNSNFTSNVASGKGGSIYYSYKPAAIDDHTVFADNSAPYGDNIASYPAQIGSLGGNISEKIEIDLVSPGIPIIQEINVALYDGDGQIITMENSSQVIITPKSQDSSIKGISSFKLVNGTTKFTGFTPISQPASSQVRYEVSSKSIVREKVTKAFNSKISPLEILINFSYCKPGEQVINGQCYKCPAGTYSFDWNSTQCHKCLDNADCLGNQQMKVAKGYWRRSTNSTTLIECFIKDACKGGYHPENEHPVQCGTGYTGKLCSKCKITSDQKYQRINDFECEVCPNPIFNALRVIGLVILILAFFMVIIIANIRKTTESDFSILLRILTSYLQIITTSMSMTTKYPSSMAIIFLPIERIGGSSQTFLSFDCFINLNKPS